MPKFQFKLQSVLRHREIIEQAKQRDHAVALAKVKAVQDELSALNATMQSTNDDVRQNHLVGRLDVSFITAHRRFLMGMQRKAIDLVADLTKAQREAEAARQAVAEAAKQRKILEKLRETQEARWRAERSRKEAAATDEVNMQLYASELTEDSKFVTGDPQ